MGTRTGFATTLSFQITNATAVVLACSATSVCMAGGELPFTEEAAARGLNHTMTPQFVPAPGVQGYGCAFADLDADGDPDVILLGRDPVDGFNAGQVSVYQNNGAGFFTDRTLGAGLQASLKIDGVSVGDYNADGLPDIFLTKMGEPNALMRNQGNFTFTNQATAAGVNYIAPSMGSAWGDYDNDGWLDLHVVTYNNALPGTSTKNDKLYRNRGDGTFEDVSVAQGVANIGYGFQSVWFDYDRDGDVDLYLSQDRGHMPPLFEANHLWRNDNGILVDVSEASGANEALFSMGVACGDFDGNGWPDIYLTNIELYKDGYNRLLLNQGDGTFLESAIFWGVGQFNSSWGTIFFDFNNDTYSDLYVNNQFVDNSLHQHFGSPSCLDVASTYGVEGSSGTSYGSAVADIDDDGDLDLLIDNYGGPVQLFVNHQGETSHWLKFDFVGVGANKHGVGGSVNTRIGKRWLWREVLAGGNNYLGQNDLTIHVGIDDAIVADEVIVKWPGGTPTRVLTNVPADARWTLYPPSRLGDVAGDGKVLLDDFFAFLDCFGNAITPGCEIMDFDGDSQITLADFNQFLLTYDGSLEDCDEDGQLDLLEILLNPAIDADHDGIRDECETVPGDATGDGLVNIDDIFEVVASWGPCKLGEDCPADLDGNAVVDIDDLFLVISNWT